MDWPLNEINSFSRSVKTIFTTIFTYTYGTICILCGKTDLYALNSFRENNRKSCQRGYRMKSGNLTRLGEIINISISKSVRAGRHPGNGLRAWRMVQHAGHRPQQTTSAHSLIAFNGAASHETTNSTLSYPPQVNEVDRHGFSCHRDGTGIATSPLALYANHRESVANYTQPTRALLVINPPSPTCYFLVLDPLFHNKYKLPVLPACPGRALLLLRPRSYSAPHHPDTPKARTWPRATHHRRPQGRRLYS